MTRQRAFAAHTAHLASPGREVEKGYAPAAASAGKAAGRSPFAVVNSC